MITTLSHHQEAIKEAWFNAVLESYPESSRKYFARVEKSFTNPVGANLAHSLNALLDELFLEEPDSTKIMDHLQMILRIKAVQDVLPSQAISFVPALKQIIERLVPKEDLPFEALGDFYSDLDTVTLWALDIYVESRDLIYELRLKQIKENNDILVRAQLLDQSLDMDDFMKCPSSLDQGGSCAGSCQSEKGV